MQYLQLHRCFASALPTSTLERIGPSSWNGLDQPTGEVYPRTNTSHAGEQGTSMDPEELTGYYTYRSFLNQQNPVDDFNQIKFAEAEVFLLFSRDQTIGGTLSFPAAPAAQTKNFMDLSGRVLGWSPLRVHFTARGRANTAIFDYLYDYEGGVAPYLPQGKDQRL